MSSASSLHIDFSIAKSGNKTCAAEGRYLHSKYNPLTEGEKFAESVSADFSPFCIVVIEPALSYCASSLRVRFPNAKICCIRFTPCFSEYDSLWDYVFYTEDSDFSLLNEDLFSILGEEALISGLFLDWLPSKNAFLSLNEKCWKEIQKAVLKARDVLGTRSYFSKRWLKNSVLFCKNIQRGFTLKKTQKDVLIAASGPSLLSSLPFIKTFRNRFFLIAVSSAFLPLVKNGISPDFTISSDGGFWAKRHLYTPGNYIKNKNVFALEQEGAAFSKLYDEDSIIPLCYEDGIGKELLKAIDCPFMLSKRNGTVAGTALEFAFSFTDKNIFLAGFDQSPSSSFQHTQPNAIELISQMNDTRLSPEETRNTKSRFNSANTLEIYRNWFISNSQKFSKRVFRLSDNYSFSFSLGSIKDINWTDFAGYSKDTDGTLQDFKQITLPFEIKLTAKERKEKLISKIKEISSTELFLNEVFPMDLLLIKREKDTDKKEELKLNAARKITDFIKELSLLL